MAKITLDIPDELLRKVLEDDDYLLVFLAQVRKLLEEYKNDSKQRQN